MELCQQTATLLVGGRAEQVAWGDLPYPAQKGRRMKIAKPGDKLKCRDRPGCFLCGRIRKKPTSKHRLDTIRVGFGKHSPTFVICIDCGFKSTVRELKAAIETKFLKLQEEANQ
jgi:hypothetical protein